MCVALTACKRRQRFRTDRIYDERRTLVADRRLSGHLSCSWGRGRYRVLRYLGNPSCFPEGNNGLRNRMNWNDKKFIIGGLNGLGMRTARRRSTLECNNTM